MERSNGIKIFIAGDFCVYHPERVSLGHELKKSLISAMSELLTLKVLCK